MIERTPWLEAYILLVLRIDKAFHEVDASYFLDTYHGPSELKAAIQQEPVLRFQQLAEQARALQESLPEQGFNPSRQEYLEKHLLALRTITEVQSGAEMPFFEEVGRVFDIVPQWIPEEEFEAALKLIDQALPGKGDLRQRYQTWQENIRLPVKETGDALAVMQAILAEARGRTQRLVNLPEGEALEIQPVRGVNYGAANWYQGNYRSLMQLNLDRPIYTHSLLYQLCHEAYPGHHTESCLKEKMIFRKKGYLEQSVFFALGPQLLIAEGIAVLATRLIFTSQEAADLINTLVMPLLEPQAADVDLARLFEAFNLISPDEMGSNLATLIEAGRSEDEVVEYAMAYMPFSEKQVRSYLPALGTPLSRLYSFSYSQGSRLINPLLQGRDRDAVIRMLLTEQVTPSGLRRMGEEKAL